MSKRFIVCINQPTAEEEGSFLNYVKSEGLGWWHWISGVWLLVDGDENLTAAEMRDVVGTYFSNKRRIVVELTGGGDSWAGWGPSEPDKNMFKWLHENWH